VTLLAARGRFLGGVRGVEPRVLAAPVALTVLGAAVRLATLGRQSLWYDEAFTPVHVLHGSLVATLHAVVHTENTPPLWYILEWAITRVLGTGAVDLRLLSALAGIATVPVVWAIAAELAGRRAALLASTLAAVNPLLVWYSQEARAYGLLVLTATLAMLCFVRALATPTPRRMALFGLAASFAQLTHYFAAFLVMPMIVWLALAARWQLGPDRRARGPGWLARGLGTRARGPGGLARGLGTRARGPGGLAAGPWALAASLSLPILTAAALVPLALAQAGHGTQWIGRWALASRLQVIPQYYLTGYSGAPLGHGVELLVGLVALAGIGFALWRVLEPVEERAALMALTLAACGVLVPVGLALVGADYLAPRNLVGAMAPVTVLLGVVVGARRTGTAGLALGGLLALAFATIALAVDLSPRLQRGDWAGVAEVLRRAPPDRAIVTVELGSAPLEYYLPPLRVLARNHTTSVREVDEVGYEPLRSSAGRTPADGFHLIERCNIRGLIVYRFASPRPVTISGQALREQTITSAHPEALVPKIAEK
jgi:4-amino-4-deoxy-L-arabinose transferase-like glycosyltransferase